MDDLTTSVRTAHADAWQRQGLLRAAQGGATAELPGVRLMASGLPHAQWNNGDVTDPALVELDAVRAWYAARGADWGLRVPAGAPWSSGTHGLRQRLMGLRPSAFAPAPGVPALGIRAAGAGDVRAVVAVDCAAFGGDPGQAVSWVGPHLTAPGVTVVLAELDGEPVATAYSVQSDGRAGPAVHLAGVGVVPRARRRGIAAAVSTWLLARAFDAGAQLAHLQPDTDGAARVYGRLGFVEVGGLDVYVGLASGRD